MKTIKMTLLVCAVVTLTGCTPITEIVKVVWGSSTRSLEKARVNAISKTYRCSFDDCFDSVLTLTHAEAVYLKKHDDEDKVVDGEEDSTKPDVQGAFDVFIKNRAKKHIVVMGIKGNVDTTEVGIFFSQLNLTTVKLEVSSLSSSAKRKVAEAIFNELDSQFSAVE